jgi:crossover junction endodeoxyribonuclease RuvC
MPNNIIVGLDPGINLVGFSFITGSKKEPKILDFGVLKTEPLPKEMMHLRLLEIAEDFESLLIKYKPSKAVVEDLFFFKNQKTIIAVSQARGMLLYLLAKHNVEVLSMTPLQLKQYLCGYGRATKKQVQFMVQKVYKLDSIPKPDDAADSLALAWLGL